MPQAIWRSARRSSAAQTPAPQVAARRLADLAAARQLAEHPPQLLAIHVGELLAERVQIARAIQVQISLHDLFNGQHIPTIQTAAGVAPVALSGVRRAGEGLEIPPPPFRDARLARKEAADAYNVREGADDAARRCGSG